MMVYRNIFIEFLALKTKIRIELAFSVAISGFLYIKNRVCTKKLIAFMVLIDKNIYKSDYC